MHTPDTVFNIRSALSVSHIDFFCHKHYQYQGFNFWLLLTLFALLLQLRPHHYEATPATFK